MKIYARQVNPEYQDNFTALDDVENGCIIVEGRETPVDAYGTVDYATGSGNYDLIFRIERRFDNEETLRDVIQDLCPPARKRFYNIREIHQISELLNRAYEYGLDGYEIAEFLSIVDGREWSTRVITGCCQGDYERIYYLDSEWNEEGLEAFETIWFNNGTEWIIHDSDIEPESAEDVDGYGVYCINYGIDDVRKEIADAEGVSPEDVILYAYCGKRDYWEAA